jgi:hypothetical protein
MRSVICDREFCVLSQRILGGDSRTLSSMMLQKCVIALMVSESVLISSGALARGTNMHEFASSRHDDPIFEPLWQNERFTTYRAGRFHHGHKCCGGGYFQTGY